MYKRSETFRKTMSNAFSFKTRDDIEEMFHNKGGEHIDALIKRKDEHELPASDAKVACMRCYGIHPLRAV
jgi:hypothetical protein